MKVYHLVLKRERIKKNIATLDHHYTEFYHSREEIQKKIKLLNQELQAIEHILKKMMVYDIKGKQKTSQ